MGMRLEGQEMVCRLLTHFLYGSKENCKRCVHINSQSSVWSLVVNFQTFLISHRVTAASTWAGGVSVCVHACVCVCVVDQSRSTVLQHLTAQSSYSVSTSIITGK